MPLLKLRFPQNHRDFAGTAQSQPAPTSTRDSRKWVMRSNTANDVLLNTLMIDLHNKFNGNVRTVFSTYNPNTFYQDVTVVFTNNRIATTVFKGRELDPEFLALCALIYDLPEQDGG